MGVLSRAALLASLLLAGCTEPEGECNTWCGQLDTCGYLPSALGIDDENCRERCTISKMDRDPEVARAETIVHECYARHGDDCSLLGECLRREPPTGSMVGIGRVRVQIVLEDGISCSTPGAVSSRTFLFAPPYEVREESLAPAAVEPSIMSEPAPPVTPTRPANEPREGTCEQASMPMTMPDASAPSGRAIATFAPLTMAAGQYVPAIKLIGDGSCKLLRASELDAKPLLVRAGTTVSIVLYPDTDEVEPDACKTAGACLKYSLVSELIDVCEGVPVDGMQCMDAIDQDGDGLIDCQDPACAAQPPCSCGDACPPPNNMLDVGQQVQEDAGM